MRVRDRLNSVIGGDESISALISPLRTSFIPADFERAERVLLSRESNLRLEIDNLKKLNAALVENNQFRELEMLRIEAELDVHKSAGGGDASAVYELKRRNRELEREKAKLEELVKSEYEGWKGLVAKLGRDASKLGAVGSGKSHGSVGVGVAVKLETGIDGDEIGGGHGGGPTLSAGVMKSSYINAGMVDNHHECAPKQKNTSCEKPSSNIHKNTGSLDMTGLDRKPRVLKRKSASSASGSHDENGSGKFRKDSKETHSISETKQHQEMSLKPDGLPFMPSRVLGDYSDSNDSAGQNLPLTHDRINSRESEQKTVAEQKSKEILKVPPELNSDCYDLLADLSSSSSSSSSDSSSSSSSSDSEDDPLLRSVLDDVISKAKAVEGTCCSS